MKHLKVLSSERFTPTLAVASAVLPVTNNMAARFALPSKDKLIRAAARTRRQLDVNMPPIPVERILLCGDPEMLRVLEKSSFWLANGTFKFAPKMFYQLYSIHVSVSGVAPACLYLFLPMKIKKPTIAFGRFI